MVRGIEKFKEYFSNYSGQYTFIGGTACDIILGKMGVDFRQTKDIDMVLLIEALNSEFVERFISFIESGGYQHIDKGTDKSQFYRFEKPDNISFPYMIELFSKSPDYLQTIESRLTPVHVSEDVVSLSAILLDDEYYSLLTEGAVSVDGVSVLELEYLILFKMKAWLDLCERKAKGENIDSRNIKKHKNDVLRLAVNIKKETKIAISGQIKEDAFCFLEQTEKEPIDMKTLGIRGVTYQEVLEDISICYGLRFL